MITLQDAINQLRSLPRRKYCKLLDEPQETEALRDLLVSIIESHTQDRDYIRKRNQCLGQAESITNNEIGYCDVSKNSKEWDCAFLKNVNVVYRAKFGV